MSYAKHDAAPAGLLDVWDTTDYHPRTDLSTNITWVANTAQTVQINDISHGYFLGALDADAYYLISTDGTDATASDTAITAGAINESDQIYIAPGEWFSIFHGTNSGTLSLTPTNATPHINRNSVDVTERSMTVDTDRPRWLGTSVNADPSTSIVVCKPDVYTNLCVQSNDFSTWTQTGTPVVTDNSDGTFDIEDNDGAAFELILLNGSKATYTVGETATVGFVVKQDAVGRATRFPLFRMQFSAGASGVSDIGFDTSTGEYSTVTTVDASIANVEVRDMQDGYWLVTAEISNTNSGSYHAVIYPAAGASAVWTYQNTATGTITLKHVQYVNGTEIGPLIQTTGTAASNPATQTLALPQNPENEIGPGQYPDWILFDEGINEFSKPQITFSTDDIYYGDLSSNRFGTPTSSPVNVTETRVPIPTSTGDVVFTASIDCIIEMGNSVVVTDSNSRKVYKGEIVELDPGANTHLAVVSAVATETGNFSLMPTEADIS